MNYFLRTQSYKIFLTKHKQIFSVTSVLFKLPCNIGCFEIAGMDQWIEKYGSVDLKMIDV